MNPHMNLCLANGKYRAKRGAAGKRNPILLRGIAEHEIASKPKIVGNWPPSAKVVVFGH